MTKKELLELLKDVPDDAKIFVWGDHGQQSFVADYINVTDDKCDDIKYVDDDEVCEWLADDDIVNANITGVQIS